MRKKIDNTYIADKIKLIAESQNAEDQHWLYTQVQDINLDRLVYMTWQSKLSDNRFLFEMHVIISHSWFQ